MVYGAFYLKDRWEASALPDGSVEKACDDLEDYHGWAVIGLTLTCVFGVLLEDGWLPYYIAVGVGVGLTCFGWGCAWLESGVKDEHVMR